MLDHFETVTCGRCGGSGRYSYCTMYGSTCFGCSGTGNRYTKRGQAAVEYYRNLCCKLAKDVLVGDLILQDWPVRKWHKVISVGIDKLNPHLWLLGCAEYSYGASPETFVRIGHTKEEKVALRAQALAFQDTLTKQGKPRKAKHVPQLNSQSS